MAEFKNLKGTFDGKPDGIQRVDLNELYKLISELISCGFRGSAQEVVDEHITEYISNVSHLVVEELTLKCNCCGKEMTNEAGKSMVGHKIIVDVSVNSGFSEKFVKKQMGPYKTKKTYCICFECWLRAQGFIP